MPLSLSAEQKSINDIFYSNIQYVIPDYQRAYSWGFDQCNQLYIDFLSAFNDNRDYFIGNIVIAKSFDSRKQPQVVDGQQRLITIWLLLKVLSVLCQSLRIADTYLVISSMRINEEDILKIRSKVFETTDEQYIKDIYNYNAQRFSIRLDEVSDTKGEIKESNCHSRFEYVALLFYSNLHGVGVERLEKFTSFVIDHIFLLPIELTGDNMRDANDRALSIFETINNRGMSLENADIFKARLYNKAMIKGEEDEDMFKKLWAEFRQSAEDLNLSVDDIFRYYSHIIRGRENIITSEKNLRDFFLFDSASPISNYDYREIMRELLKIVDILRQIQQMEVGDDLVGPWLQVLEEYSNVYPKYAIVNYLFVNPKYRLLEFQEFLIRLVRYSYSLGATTNVKFEIYKIISKTTKGLALDDYCLPFPMENFNQYKMLRKGYALLAYYLCGGKLMKRVWYDKLLINSDKCMLDMKGWTDDQEDYAIKSLCNTIAIPIPAQRKNMEQKYVYYRDNGIFHHSRIFFDSMHSFKDFVSYENEMNRMFNHFFVDAKWKN